MSDPTGDALKACRYCDGTGDVTRADGEWLGTCDCPGNALTPPVSMDEEVVEVLEDIIVLIENSEPYNAQDVARALLTRIKDAK